MTTTAAASATVEATRTGIAPAAPHDPLFGLVAGVARAGIPGLEPEPAFGGLPAAFYTSNAGQMALDRDWYVSHVPDGDGIVVDLCCGGGRVTEALARAGRTCVAVDSSEDMIRRAGARLAAAGADVAALATVVQADARTFRLPEPADAVVLGGLTVTLFLPGSERLRLFDRCRDLLRPGGRLLFDYSPLPPPGVPDTMHQVFPCEIDGDRGFVLVGHRHLRSLGQQVSNFYGELIRPDGTTRRFLSYVEFTMLSHEQVSRELAQAGFAVRDTCDPYGRDGGIGRGWRLVECEAVE